MIRSAYVSRTVLDPFSFSLAIRRPDLPLGPPCLLRERVATPIAEDDAFLEPPMLGREDVPFGLRVPRIEMSPDVPVRQCPLGEDHRQDPLVREVPSRHRQEPPLLPAAAPQLIVERRVEVDEPEPARGPRAEERRRREDVAPRPEVRSALLPPDLVQLDRVPAARGHPEPRREPIEGHALPGARVEYRRPLARRRVRRGQLGRDQRRDLRRDRVETLLDLRRQSHRLSSREYDSGFRR
jgi:hypothetical protein